MTDNRSVTCSAFACRNFAHTVDDTGLNHVIRRKKLEKLFKTPKTKLPEHVNSSVSQAASLESTADQLRILAEFNNLLVTFALAKNPNTPVDALCVLWTRILPSVKEFGSFSVTFKDSEINYSHARPLGECLDDISMHRNTDRALKELIIKDVGYCVTEKSIEEAVRRASRKLTQHRDTGDGFVNQNGSWELPANNYSDDLVDFLESGSAAVINPTARTEVLRQINLANGRRKLGTGGISR